MADICAATYCLDFPMAASFPHFLHGDEILSSYVDGLTPSPAKHESFVIVEPVSNSDNSTPTIDI